MLNIIAVLSYFVVLGLSMWVASEHESELARIRKTWKLAQ